MRKDFAISNFLIVGLARNSGHKISKEVKKINDAFSGAASVDWLVIESDSDDKTLDELNALSHVISLRYITLGSLEKKHPKRTERIALCRNRYLDEIKSNRSYEKIDYVVIADLDGANCELTLESIQSCWSIEVDWDACFANQSKAYYDVWALRHEIWSPNDCWENRKFLFDNGVSSFQASYVAVWSRMVRIDKAAQPIQVESAFGGLGIYKKSIIMNARYNGLNSKDEETCEHVSFHRHLHEAGYQLYIVPSLINCSWSEHSVILKPIKKLKARLRSYILGFITLFISKEDLKILLKKEK